jgi:anti-sigma B factor antagonist
MAALTVNRTRVGGVALCVATGDLELSSVGELRVAVLGAAEGVERLRLDLSGVAFIDTSGLAALLELRSSLHAADVGFEITAVDGAVRRAVEITGLSDLLR